VSGDVIVRADGVARTFGRGSSAVVAVHGVTCVVRAGDMIALAGASGSGKSTLMHLLAGLDVPTAGTITWPAIGDRAALRPGPIAVVFQAPSLMPPLDVVENVALPLQLAGVDRVTALQSAELALRRLDLESLASSLPEELSGGQAQRVAVARVLVGRPRLILADEPTGQLDHASGAMVIDALITTADEIGAALVVNTHDALVAQRFPQRWTMHDGRLTITSDPTRALAEAGS
jgi:ABC-type lipoprotein export system ATPase subunit